MFKTELVNGGLVTSRDASLLNPGEMSKTDGVVYRPHSQSLHRVPGRTVFVSPGGSAWAGLAALRFRSGNVHLFYQQGTTFRISGAGPTTFFTSLDTGIGTGALVAVPYNNKYYIFNGVINKVVRADATMRDCGLNPVTTPPAAEIISGTWQLASTGFFEYWVTEVAEISDNGVSSPVESDFVGTPVTIEVTNTSSAVKITMPDPVNSTATKRRVYRAGPKEAVGDQLFPVGERIAELDVATTSFTDG